MYSLDVQRVYDKVYNLCLYDNLCPCGDSSDYSTSALANSIALAVAFSLSGPGLGSQR